MKDPAFLFYPGDASEDTQFMNRLERGAYFDILKAQKKFGKFTLDQLKKVLGGDFESCWGSLSLVLKHEDGFYFIEWVAEKIDERKKYSESRRQNRSKNKDSDTYEEHMKDISKTSKEDMVIEDVIDNVNLDSFEKGGTGGKTFDLVDESPAKSKQRGRVVFIPPTVEEMKKYFFENGFDPAVGERAWTGYAEADWHDSTGKKVLNWKQKCQNVWFKDDNKLKTNTNEIPKGATNQQAGMLVAGAMNTFLTRCEAYRHRYGMEPPVEWFEKFNLENGTNIQPKLEAKHG